MLFPTVEGTQCVSTQTTVIFSTFHRPKLYVGAGGDVVVVVVVGGGGGGGKVT
jgi:hypothetical protein